MSSFWKNLVSKLLAPSRESRGVSHSDSGFSQNASDYPNTFQSTTDESLDEDSRIFDPALLHYSRAFRRGDPRFNDADSHRRWTETRQQVIHHLLQIINESHWKDHLVLRGSLLLKAWLGDEAREPGDIDWVFRPTKVGINDSLAIELFDDLRRRVAENPVVGKAEIEINKIATDDIWTYERAAGKRIIFPWKLDGLPPGSIQMDVVFKEDLWNDPIQTLIPTSENSSLLIWSVDKELSLAWKLLWLETDIYPQGKDLYDATLLAEQTHLSLDLLKLVLQSGDWRPRGTELTAEFPLEWEVDWENFKLEYPWIEGEAEEWQARLSKALQPTFTNGSFLR